MDAHLLFEGRAKGAEKENKIRLNNTIMDASSDKKQHKLTEQKYLIPFVMITLLFG